MPDTQAVAAFLFREARLMDEHRYLEWLSLWGEGETIYWVPCNEDDIDPSRQVSLIYDDAERLRQRIERLMSDSVLAQQPLPRARRVLSNLEVQPQPGGSEIEVASNFLLATARSGRQELWAGRSIHRLRVAGAEFRIHSKKVLLINSDLEMPLLQFLI